MTCKKNMGLWAYGPALLSWVDVDNVLSPDCQRVQAHCNAQLLGNLQAKLMQVELHRKGLPAVRAHPIGGWFGSGVGK
jgi:hypothetical protein